MYSEFFSLYAFFTGEMNKSELRKIYLAKRKALPRARRDISSRQIAQTFFDKSDLSKVRFLHCFLPIEKLAEVDTTFIFRRIWEDFRDVKTVVPRVDQATAEIENLTYSATDELLRSAWQIDEPIHHEKISPEEIDLVLVPLLCFDRGGHRVGYGKGFYDRFLALCRSDCLKIGLSFFPPEEEIEDANSADVRLNFCVTPDHVYAMQGSNSH